MKSKFNLSKYCRYIPVFGGSISRRSTGALPHRHKEDKGRNRTKRNEWIEACESVGHLPFPKTQKGLLRVAIPNYFLLKL